MQIKYSIFHTLWQYRALELLTHGKQHCPKKGRTLVCEALDQPKVPSGK